MLKKIIFGIGIIAVIGLGYRFKDVSSRGLKIAARQWDGAQAFEMVNKQ